MNRKTPYTQIQISKEVKDKFSLFSKKYFKTYTDALDKILYFFEHTGYNPLEPENSKIASVDIGEMEHKILDKQERVIKILNKFERDYLSKDLVCSELIYNTLVLGSELENKSVPNPILTDQKNIDLVSDSEKKLKEIKGEVMDLLNQFEYKEGLFGENNKRVISLKEEAFRSLKNKIESI